MVRGSVLAFRGLTIGKAFELAFQIHQPGRLAEPEAVSRCVERADSGTG